jgi:hypothetical protein
MSASSCPGDAEICCGHDHRSGGAVRSGGGRRTGFRARAARLGGSPPRPGPPERRTKGAVRDRQRHSCRSPLYVRRPGGPRRAPRRRLPRRATLHPRHPADHVPRPALEHPSVRGLRHRGRRQCALPLPARPGAARSLGRVRSAHPDGPRQRRSSQRRRGRSGRRRHRLGARHGEPLRGDPAERGEHLDDHQRPRSGARRHVRGRGGASGCRGRIDHGDRPERCPQGVHRAGHVHLSAAAIAASRRGSDRLVHGQRTEVQPDLAVRVSHP